MYRDADEPGAHKGSTAGKWVLAGFLFIAAYFLYTEHRAHLFGALPYLLLAACPLMHMLHHRGHGHRQGHPREGNGPVPESDHNSAQEDARNDRAHR